MKNLIVVGIDPGLTGGISILRYSKNLEETLKNGRVYPIPISKTKINLTTENKNKTKNKTKDKTKNRKKQQNRVDVISFIKLISQYKNIICYLEYPQARPNQSSVSTATTFFNYGCLWSSLVNLNIPVKEISPLSWQILYTLEPFKDIINGFEGKDRSISIAKNYGVNLKPTKRAKEDSDGLSDAFCISIYGLLKENRLI